MIRSPFALFRPYEDCLTVSLFTKKDRVQSSRLAERLGTSFACPKQVHGVRTVNVSEPLNRTVEADGVITDQADLTLAVLSADCQTFVVYAPKKHVAGVLHAGWRGLLAGAIPSFFKTLHEEFGALPEDALVGASPSLCRNCSEFSDPLRELPGIDPKFFIGRLVDLHGIADAQLHALGIAKDRLERLPDCPRCQNNAYWSYRGGDQAAVREGWENALTCTLR